MTRCCDQKAVTEICTPLFESTLINYFHYLRAYPDGKAILLATDGDPLKYCVEHKLCPTLESWSPDGDKSIVWSDHFFGVYAFEPVNFDKTKSVLNEKFNLDYILNFVEQNEQYYEFYGYGIEGTTDSDEAMTFYLKNLNMLNEFRYVFKEQSFELINHHLNTNNFIHLYPELKDNATKSLQKVFSVRPKNDNQEIIKPPQKYHLSGKYEGIVLTHRQVEILRALSEKFSTKRVAQLLNVSPRTVEKHINILRQKLDCIDKAELCVVYRTILPSIR